MQCESRFFFCFPQCCFEWMLSRVAESAGKVPETGAWVFCSADQEQLSIVNDEGSATGFGVAPVLLTTPFAPARSQ